MDFILIFSWFDILTHSKAQLYLPAYLCLILNEVPIIYDNAMLFDKSPDELSDASVEMSLSDSSGGKLCGNWLRLRLRNVYRSEKFYFNIFDNYTT
jgi:diaminopimelate epimerase